MNWMMGAVLVATALVAAGLGLSAVLILERRVLKLPVSIFVDSVAATVFLFDGEVLVDSTPGARALIASSQSRGTAWVKLMAYLAPHFTELEARLLRLPYEGVLALASTAGSGRLWYCRPNCAAV